MSRNLDSSLASALSDQAIYPVVLAMITFKSATRYVWTGVGNFVYAGNTYVGVGSFGSVGAISEGIDVQAQGTTISLSGIDPTLQAECMSDIKLGAPVKLWFGLLNNGVLIGVPYLMFSGLVDKPVLNTGVDQLTITLALESRLIDLQRATQRRYTAADQHVAYPTDRAFNWVEILNDISLLWGS